MSRKVYNDGALVEEWDDATHIYRRFGGGEVVERAYTAAEVDSGAVAQRAATQQRLRDHLATGVADILRARTAALEDQAKAQALRTQALDAKAATLAQRQTVAGFTPATAYSAAQLGQVRNAIVDALARVEEIQQALADFYAYRVQVDANAVITDDALLWLARLASGVLDDA